MNIILTMHRYCSGVHDCKFLWLFHTTVEPRYKEDGYNKTLLQQGNFAGPNLYFFVFFTMI